MCGGQEEQLAANQRLAEQRGLLSPLSVGADRSTQPIQFIQPINGGIQPIGILQPSGDPNDGFGGTLENSPTITPFNFQPSFDDIVANNAKPVITQGGGSANISLSPGQGVVKKPPRFV